MDHGHPPQLNTPTGLPAREIALAALVSLLLFGVYMLTFDGTLHSTDTLSMLAVAENMIKHGTVDTVQLENWESAALGPDGRPYTFFPIGPSLLMIPFYFIALHLPLLGLSQTTILLMPFSGALAGGFIYLTCRRLGYSRNPALSATLLGGVGTMIWVYVYDLTAEPLTYFSLAVAFYFALAYRQDGRLRQLFLMSLALALTLLHKVVNLGIVPFFLWYVAIPNFRIFDFKRFNWRAIAVAAPAVVLAVLAFFAYNSYRFSDPLDAGYRFNYFFRIPLWVGVVGLLTNPYKSIFLYVPLFILLPFTVKSMWRKHPRELVLILGLLVAYFIIFGTIFFDWGGGRSWGPRYLVPLNGLLTLLLLPLIDRTWQPGQWPARAALFVVGGASIGLQILGMSARDNVFLNADDYWVRPPNMAVWGQLRWDQPDQWPIWGHILRFNPTKFDLVWRWQWQTVEHFDWLTLAAELLIVALAGGGIWLWLRRKGHLPPIWAGAAWLLALALVGVILLRSANDPRSIKQADEAARLWPAYSDLTRQLPELVSPADTVIFTDRRFEFYLFDTDKSPAQRLMVAKHTQPDILAAIPTVIEERVAGKIWLVTDDLDNRQLAYATELYLRARGQPVAYHQFGDTVQLTAFQLDPAAGYPHLTPEPALDAVLRPGDERFNGIAALLGWEWPTLPAAAPRLQPGGSYPLQLYWIFEGKSPDDRFFTRLLTARGEIAAESWAAPQAANRDVIGQLNIDELTLAVPSNLPPGEYTLQIGFSIPVVDAGELTFDLPPELTRIDVVSPAAKAE